MTAAPLARGTAPGEKPEDAGRAGRRLPAGRAGLLILAAGAIMAALLALPGPTVLALRADDLIVLLDAGHRVLQGQVPHRDFSMSLGPLMAVLPAWGRMIGGDAGAAFPTAAALLTALAAPVFARILTARLPPLLSVPAGIFALALLAAPIDPGEVVTAIGATGWQHRIGWAGLFVLFVMALPPRDADRRSPTADAVSAGAIATVLLLTEPAFGLAALLFLLFLATDRRLRVEALGGIALCGLVLAAAESVFGFASAYAGDALRAFRADPPFRGTAIEVFDRGSAGLAGIADLVLFLLAAGSCLIRAGNARTALFLLLCAAGGFALFDRSQQVWGILTLHAGTTVAAERIRRAARSGEMSMIVAGAPLLALAMLSPPAFHFGTAILIHRVAPSILETFRFDDSVLRNVLIADFRTGGAHRTALADAARIADGVRAVAALRPSGGIVTLDDADPFSLILDLPPAMGGIAGLGPGMTADARNLPPPENVFANAAVVMIPKSGPAGPGRRGTTADGLRRIYGPFIESRFVLTAESEHWLIYGRATRPLNETMQAPPEP